MEHQYRDRHASGSQALPVSLEDKLPYNSELFTSAEAQEHASRKSIVGRTAVIGVAVIVLLIGMTALLLTYTCVLNTCSVSNLEIVSTAPLGRVLTISQVASHVAPFSVPIVMGLCSNLLGAMWLRSSRKNTLNRPSPMQYVMLCSCSHKQLMQLTRLGLLLSLCNGANVPALFSSLRYIFGLNNNVSNKTLATPRLLRTCIIILSSLLLSTYLAAAADAWLHASSSSVNLVSVVPYSLSDLATIQRDYGRQINATICDPATYNDGTKSQQTCGLVSGGSLGDGKTRTEGLRVVSNSSSLHRVEFTDNQIAILVPQSLPANTTYVAQTLGVTSRCMRCVSLQFFFFVHERTDIRSLSVTRDCLAPTTSAAGLNYGPMASLLLNCSAHGIQYNGTASHSNLCALDADGSCIAGYSIPSK